jgi:hypothetical protein
MIGKNGLPIIFEARFLWRRQISPDHRRRPGICASVKAVLGLGFNDRSLTAAKDGEAAFRRMQPDIVLCER